MIKIVYLIAFLSLYIQTLTSSPPNNPSVTLQQRWQYVQELEEKGLPASAIEELEQILLTVDKNRQTQEWLKIHFQIFKLTLDIDQEDWQKVLIEAEKLLTLIPPSSERSIASFLVADLYLIYYQQHKSIIDRRTEEQSEQLPENISSWTLANFAQKINTLQQDALLISAQLQRSNTTHFNLLLTYNEISPLLTPTVFDVLMYARIKALTALNEPTLLESAYHKLMEFQRLRNNLAALAYFDLQYHRQKTNEQPESTFLPVLDSLVNVYKHTEGVVEILYAKANVWLNQSERPDHKRRAYDICEEGIKNHPHYHRIGILKNLQQQITLPFINLQHTAVVSYKKPLQVRFETANIDELVVEIYRIDLNPLDFELLQIQPQTIEQHPIQKKLIDVRLVSIPQNTNFDKTKTSLNIQLPGYGKYQLVAYPRTGSLAGNSAVSHITVSDLTYIIRSVDSQHMGVYVLDRITGKPVRQAAIHLYSLQWNNNLYQIKSEASVVSNREGYAVLPLTNNNQFVMLQLGKGKDTFFTDRNYIHSFSEEVLPQNFQSQIQIFTNRKVYRPGQAVSFKAIAFYANQLKEEVSVGETMVVRLVDTNWTEIASKTLTTNEFGTAAADFSIPKGSLNGTWHLVVNDRFQTAIMVEDIKLPTFEVTINNPSVPIRFGTETTVKANVKALAGHPIPGSRIQYTVHRMVHPLWRFFPITQEILVSSGVTTTNREGTFSIQFTPEKSPQAPSFRPQRHSYIYRITVNATDLKGETQQSVLNLPISEQYLFVETSLQPLMAMQKNLTVTVNVANILGERVSDTMRYSLIQLEESQEFHENIVSSEHFPLVDRRTVLSGEFLSTNKSLTLPLGRLSPGRYRFKMTTLHPGDTITHYEKMVILYHPKSRRPAVKSYQWSPKTQFELKSGETANVQFGTSVRRAHVLKEVLQGDSVIMSRWVLFNNEIKTFPIIFHNQYTKSGLSVHFTFVRDGQLFVQRYSLTHKRNDKTITPTVSVFRDKLTPGESSEWTVTIPDAKNKPVELMLTMFDASLDHFSPLEWNFNPLYRPEFRLSPVWQGSQYTNANIWGFFTQTAIDIPEHNIATLKTWNLPTQPVFIGLHKRLRASQTEATDNREVQEETNQPTPIPFNRHIRQNLTEQAFFIPQLYADSLGQFRFQFTMPERLTRWNFKMLAHTPDLYHGQSLTTVTTSKDLMIQLNKPRFVRESDETVLSATLTNLSDSTLVIATRLHLRDAGNGESIDMEGKSEQQWVLGPGEEKPVFWSIGKLLGRDLIICQIEATSDAFTDGEQHYIPVLPDRILLTESQPFTVSETHTTLLTFDDWKLKEPEVATHSLQFEFTSQPIWMAIQALPAMTQMHGESTIDIFTRWFSRMKALQILNENPPIRQWVERNNHFGDNAFVSPLQKNESLKNLLLQETPWVNVARSESENMQQLIWLFDYNRQSLELRTLFEQLANRQLSDGSFAWFSEMKGSRWVSQQIAEGISHLYSPKAPQPELDRMIRMLLQYLDAELTRDFIQIKSQNIPFERERTIQSEQLHYLAIRSFFMNIPIEQSHTAAYDYFLSQTNNHRRSFNLFDKALAARVLYRHGKISSATELLNSLRENAVRSSERGMYWANVNRGHQWSERPISIHANIMMTFEEISGQSADLEKMKIWLLRQKQTQLWESPIATLHAINALTNYGDRTLDRTPTYSIRIKQADGSPIPENYVVTDIMRKELRNNEIPDTLQISVVEPNANETLAWGALHWQYFTDIQRMVTSGTGFSIHRRYYLEKIIHNQKQLIALDHASKQTLQKGDRLVSRTVVTADRDFEFVTLVDHRASCLEPEKPLSSMVMQERLHYYRTVTDASTRYFFPYFPQGTYVFENTYFITHTGTFSGGFVQIQCQYAPEFNAHAPGQRITITDIP